VSEPIPPIEPPVGPKRKPNPFERLGAFLSKLAPSGRTVRPLFTCSHLYANGTSAWSACYWAYGSIGWAWYSRCSRCGLVAPCR
jgi:hypothetical protein